jgi:parvulin-like peptidyl-prolyl isomerase
MVLLDFPQIEQKTIVRDLLQHLEAMTASLSSKGDRDGTERLQDLVKSIRESSYDSTITALAIGSAPIQYDVLSQWIKETIVERAISNIDCTPEEKALARDLFAQQQASSDRVFTLEQLEILLIRSLKIEKFIRINWESHLKTYFLQQKDHLDLACFSLMRLTNLDVARELYFRLQEREQSFEELARQYSFGLEAQTGGLVELTPLSQLHPTIAEILKASQPGQLWFPMPVEEWFAIVRMEKFIPARLDTRMRQRLLEQLFERWLDEQLKQVYEQLSLVN